MMNTALLLTIVLVAVAIGLTLLFLFTVARRALERHRTRRLDALSLKIHGQWRELVRGEIPAEEWRRDSEQCEIVQSIVIHEISAATDKDRAGLQKFLRTTGLLESTIDRVHCARGWKRRRAMLALGAMRVPEAIAPLSEALDDWQLDTRLVAVQALGRTGLAEGAEQILEMFLIGGLKIPSDPLANALVRCYLEQPEAILPYLRRSLGEARELLARVASEIATPEMADDMILLAGDPGPEVRACAAKSLAVALPAVAIPALAHLTRDEIWFVRLRAVSALNEFTQPRTIPILLEALRDSNHLVRTRAATGLVQFEHEAIEILQKIVDSRNPDALQAMISALELSGGFERVVAELGDPMLHDEVAARLLDVLRGGSASLRSVRAPERVAESVL